MRIDKEQNHDALLARALAAHGAGDLEQAKSLYGEILRVGPPNPIALHHLGLIHHAAGRHAEAIQHVERAILLAPAWSDAHCNLAALYRATGAFEAAIASGERAVALNPRLAAAHCNLGGIREDRGETEAALSAYLRACTCDPNLVQAHLNAANLLHKLGRLEEALAICLAIGARQPQATEAHFRAGNLLRELQRPREAVAAYQRAVAADPAFAEAHCNLGNTLLLQGAFADAVACFERALALAPGMADAWCNLGAAYESLGQPQASREAYQRALDCDPSMLGVRLQLYHQRRCACDWGGLDEEEARIIAALPAHRRPVVPFHLLDMDVSPALHLRAAQLWTAGLAAKPSFVHVRPTAAPGRARLRIGYLSADFQDHATAHLMAELFERHDRSAFEIIGYSYGGDDRSDMRQRLLRAFDSFVDLTALDDREAARRIFDDGIDILVELKGYTQFSRSNIAGHRPAPIQVNFLGYPGSMGADCIDYIIADPIVLPFDEAAHYREKIVHLPECYQPNDRHRAVSAQVPDRAACGLPEDAFVFCCFNNSYKITPAIFDIWMRLLDKVDGSVLWLFEAHPEVKSNLSREAQRRGIDAARLVFAPRLRSADHLARQKHADLFLDTLPYNAHTTASEALWVGLPVLTCLGSSFAGRVAASLLHAVGLPELVATSLADYEATALRLATQREELAALKERLAANRAGAALFDAPRFARHIEGAYRRMWAIHAAGEKPQAFSVPPMPR